MGNNNSKARIVISAVFSFILFLSITCGILTAGSSFTLFNNGYLKKCIDSSIYAEKNYSALQELLAEEASEHGLPENILTEQLDHDVFNKAIKNNIESDMGDTGDAGDADASVESFSSSVREAVNSYLEKNDVGKNSHITSTVDEIVEDSASYYKDYTELPFIQYFEVYRASAMNFVKIAIPVCLIIAVVIIIVIIRLHQEAAERKIYICSSLIASGIAAAAAGYVLGNRVDFKFPKSMAGYDGLIDSFFGGAAAVFWGCGIAAVILAAAILIIGKWKR